MARLEIDFEDGNDAFAVDWGGEFTRILHDVGDKVLAGPPSEPQWGGVRDVNGNTVGTWGWTP